MALRNIRFENDLLLRKKSREVKKIDEKILDLLNDMREVLEIKHGWGIAAPQIGVLKKIFLALDNNNNVIEIINPIVLEKNGSQKLLESCLSVRNASGVVERPERMKIKCLDRNGNETIIDGDQRLARILSHEFDHLEGILFIDKIINESLDVKK
ncbi:MAG: peptide deformylase [Clostridiales bacterium]|jgi:peptide deformylase|nr:peptide deformylase [Clostridiales bacterium]